MNPGSIVQARNRYWVVLPHDDPDLYLLRPLTGASDQVTAIHKGLADLVAYTLPEERVKPAAFPLPTVDDLSDAAGAHLLWQAARLSLREGASPLRSLGRISIRPRVYQFVPLLMSLRLDPVRLLIADDVGVGKTIEALLIARELWERREVKRLCVLCPPYLCDQWQQELSQKFNLEAVVIRSGTVGQLERSKPATRTIYEHFPIQVASIDFLKSERNRHQFLLHAPELVIVDEAHGAAMAHTQSQQQRHDFLREIAKDERRHLILLTATPHSGVESAFRSLLGLLSPRFAGWDIHSLDDAGRGELARHFVQRTRADIEHDWESGHCFPRRIAEDHTYRLSPAYHDLFERTYDFCAEIVRAGERLAERQRRVRYWGALALLRCVMSSPAAALAALNARRERAGEGESGRAGEDEVDFRGFVFESDDDRTDDEQPTPPMEAAEATLPDAERRKLRELARLAASLQQDGQDSKLTGCVSLVERLLADGFHPIVWCRYVATAEYVAAALEQRLGDAARVVCITGRQADDERRARIAEIEVERRRVLVATDCLSEGINLQEKFTAAIHYDLPWNPNRLEQREGRVDRFGQMARQVKAIRYFGADNPVDGVVIDVLLNKAAEIRRTLGTHVPVPEESESVTEAVLNALFLRGRRPADARQLALDFTPAEVTELHRRWDRDAERERLTRTRFAQRSLKPQEVQAELEAADAVLGDPQAVRQFVLEAAQRLGLTLRKERERGRAGEREKGRERESARAGDPWMMDVSPAGTALLPDPVRLALPPRKDGWWRVSFDSPTPEGAEYLGRNHPFVAALARYLFEEAMIRRGDAAASRCGAICTDAVVAPTTLLLLRLRFLVHRFQATPLLSEEVLAVGYRLSPGQPVDWLPQDEALRLLAAARPTANLRLDEKRRLVERELARYPSLASPVEAAAAQRAEALEAAHRRLHQAVAMRTRGLKVEPKLPPDVLGVLVLQPMAGELESGRA